MSEAAMDRVLALCDEWDKLSKGETPTTKRIREAAKPQPGDILPIFGGNLTEKELEELKERLKNPARIFVLPNDGSADFEIIEIDEAQMSLPLWGEEPCD